MTTKPQRIPLTAEELADRLVPERPQISPDGRHVAFVVAPVGRKEEERIAAIWLSRDGAPATQFTTGLVNEAHPAWSPDGASIVFVSDRAKRGKGRLYKIALDGGEALSLGDLEGDLDQSQWSPDGATIAVLRPDPETDAEKKKKEERDDAIVVDADPKLARLWLIDVATGQARQLTFGTRQIWSFAWSPDSTQLAICVTEGPDVDAACGPGELRLIPASGGASRVVATFATVPDLPVFIDTADGPTIAVRSTGHKDDPPDSVYLVPAAGGPPRNLFPGADFNIEHLSAASGRRDRLVLRVARGVHSLAFTVDPNHPELLPALSGVQQSDGSITSGPSASADGTRFAAVWSDGQVPHEVVLGSASGETTTLTTFGSSFAGKLGLVETVRWQSDGWEIEGLLHHPVDYDPAKRYPLLVEPHGGPSSFWDDQCFLDWHDWAHFMASRGYLVLAPNPRGSTARGAALQNALFDDVGGGEIRDVIAGAQALVDRGLADPDRLGIGGWSWGGYLTATTITRTTMFKAAMMGAGLANLVSDHGTGDIPSANLLYFAGLPYHHLQQYVAGSALANIKDCITPTLIVHGESDARVQPSQGAEMYRALKSLGVPVEFVRYPREPHAFGERNHQIDLLNRIAAWFERWLGAGGDG